MAKHSNGHKMHRHSIEGFLHMNETGARVTRHLQIFNLMTESPPMTDKQIAARLGLAMANVQPRISDLVRDGVLIEDGKSKDPNSGMTVRTVRIANDLDRQIAEQKRKQEQALNKKEHAQRQVNEFLDEFLKEEKGVIMFTGANIDDLDAPTLRRVIRFYMQESDNPKYQRYDIGLMPKKGN